MWNIVCNAGSTSMWDNKGREFASSAEAKAWCLHLSKHNKNYDIYKDGKLVGTGDRYGYYANRK